MRWAWDLDPDILARVPHDFPPGDVTGRLAQLAEASTCQRILRCIVFAARGHPWYFDYLCKLAMIDYRDVIMAAEYEREGARLYDFNKPLDQAQISNPYAGFSTANDPDD